MPTTDDYIEAGRQACVAFGLPVTSVTLLSHSENVVLDALLADGAHVVLRLHRSGYNTLDELRSEVAFVESLRAYGVPVPTPISTTTGEYYTSIDIGDEQRYAGAVQWLKGKPLGGPLDGTNPDVAVHFARIGEVAAQIRLHNSTWSAPEGFVRRRWDADGLMGADPLWGRFWQIDQLNNEQAKVLASARAHLFDELSALSVEGDRFGLIHSDLHLGNLMVHDDELTVIDFDDAGYGWFAHELAVALHPLLGEPTFDSARDSLLAGYRSVFALDDHEARLIDTFLVVRSLMIVGWLAARPELPVYSHLEEIIDAAVSGARSLM